MKRSDFLKKAATSTLVGITSNNLLSAQHVKKEQSVYFHYLLFWLKPDLSEEERNDFEAFFEGLKKLPYVKNLRYGRPAPSTPRNVLDVSFTYNVSMEFDSLEDLEAYGRLPEHIDLVNTYKVYFDRMIVHDSIYTF